MFSKVVSTLLEILAVIVSATLSVVLPLPVSTLLEILGGATGGATGAARQRGWFQPFLRFWSFRIGRKKSAIHTGVSTLLEILDNSS